MGKDIKKQLEKIEKQLEERRKFIKEILLQGLDNKETKERHIKALKVLMKESKTDLFIYRIDLMQINAEHFFEIYKQLEFINRGVKVPPEIVADLSLQTIQLKFLNEGSIVEYRQVIQNLTKDFSPYFTFLEWRKNKSKKWDLVKDNFVIFGGE